MKLRNLISICMICFPASNTSERGRGAIELIILTEWNRGERQTTSIERLELAPLSPY